MLKEALIQRITLLTQNLSLPELQGLAAALNVRHFLKGEIIYSQKDIANEIYFLVEGRVKIYRVNERERQIPIAIHYNGDILGETVLSSEGNRLETAETLSNTTLLAIPVVVFEQLLRVNHRFCLAIMHLMARRLTKAQHQIENLSSKDVVGRLANLLYDIACNHSEEVRSGQRLKHNLSHMDMAHLIGANRETVTSALKKLAEVGAVIHYPHSRETLVINDIDKLKAHALPGRL